MSAELIYLFDGSLDGIFCCVFESFLKKEYPTAVVPFDEPQATLFRQKEIRTDPEKSQRVLQAIVRKLGAETLDFVRRAFLICLPGRALLILNFLRLGFTHGPSVLQMLTNDTVSVLSKAVLHLNQEAHLLSGFVRFSDYGGSLVAEIEPKNFVLPLLAQHFCERFPEEHFFIHDRTHKVALLYRPYTCRFAAAEAIELPEASREEETWRALWRQFHETIEIKPRRNPGCQRGHLPLRYRGCMTEFQCLGNAQLFPEPAG